MIEFSEKQLYYLENATKKINISGGARRSGKTYLSYYYIPKRIIGRAGKPGEIFFLGHTRATLNTNVIRPLQEIWTSAVVKDINSNNISYMFGEYVHCIGTDSVKQAMKVKGSSMKYLYCDELLTFPEAVVTEFKACLDKPYSVMDATLNPGPPSHYVKDMIDNNPEHVFYQQYTIYDNPFLGDAERHFIESSYPIGTVWHKRYILGEWAIAEGAIYPHFKACNIRDGGHLVKDDQVPVGNEYVISVDYGTSNPTVALYWRVVNGVAYLLREYYWDGIKQGQLTDAEHANNIEELAKKIPGCYGSAQVIIDPSAASFITVFRQRGIFQTVLANNQVTNSRLKIGGIEVTSTALHKFKIYFNEICKHTIDGIHGYCWDDRARLEQGIEKPLKVDDHCVDALRYFVRTYLYRYFRHEFVD